MLNTTQILPDTMEKSPSKIRNCEIDLQKFGVFSLLTPSPKPTEIPSWGGGGKEKRVYETHDAKICLNFSLLLSLFHPTEFKSFILSRLEQFFMVGTRGI